MNSKRIKILPENLTNKIAAGEVVQRPESVIKELLENSIDADSKNIEVIIKRAGKNLIQVVDDGEGMSEEDVILCVQRHATSKISSIEDLEKILTYGFRGEALSSIAAVSQLEIKTEMKDEDLGTSLRFDDQNNIIKEKGSFPKGTSIAVKNLFYNTPARRNFLKTNATELKHLIETFKRTALSHPEISFKFYNDDDLVFDYRQGSLQDRMKEIFADNIFDAVIEVNEPTDFIDIQGYTGKPTFLKRNKSEQYLFVNNRYVQSRIINHAVFSAYENILEKGDYPFFILFLKIDPTKIDVNVHPTKLEIKFENEKNIYTFVNAVIKKSLGSHDLVPAMKFKEELENKEKLQLINFKKTERNDFSDRPNYSSTQHRNEKGGVFSDDEIDLLFSSINREIKSTAKNGNLDHPFNGSLSQETYHKEMPSQRESGEESKFLFSLHNKYILSQIKSGLMIIDQHVAHERILYEKALNSFSANMPFSQQLIFSPTIQLDPGDYALLKELEEYLEKLGFEIKFFSKNSVVITGVPDDVKVGTEAQVLLDIVEEYKTNQREKQLEVRDNLAKSYSCKAAIKAGDKLNEKEMRVLVDKLFATSMPYVCPHGRPIVVKIPLDELDKRFGRT